MEQYRLGKGQILGSEEFIVKNSEQRQRTDRRSANLPVENERRTGIDRREALKNHEKKHSGLHNGVFCALESLTPVRRLVSAEDRIEEGQFASALGVASLGLINLPEDLRDIKEAGKQIKGVYKGIKNFVKDGKYVNNYVSKYNHKEYQHPFSFFRGGLLHDLANPNVSKNPELAEKLLRADKTLFKTKFGEKIIKFLNTTKKDRTTTTIEEIFSTKENPIFVKAYKFVGTGKFAKFGEITARALTRTTLPGIAVLGLIEAPNIIKAMTQGENISEKIENTAKQTFKSGLNIASTTAGIAYGGAIGFKHLGAAGSLVGMGFGAILGNYLSNKLQN